MSIVEGAAYAVMFYGLYLLLRHQEARALFCFAIANVLWTLFDVMSHSWGIAFFNAACAALAFWAWWRRRPRWKKRMKSLGYKGRALIARLKARLKDAVSPLPQGA